MRVGLVGATSELGRATAACLRERGARVVPLVRRPEALPEARRLDLTDPGTMEEALEGLSVVVSCAGAPLDPWPVVPRVTFQQVDLDGHAHLARAARAAGVRRAVYVSTYGEGMEHLAYVAAHHEAEEALRAELDEVAVVRPVGMFGAFDQLLPMARLGLGVDLQSGTARTNPIAEADVAVVLAKAATADDVEAVQSVGGPEVLTRRQVWDLAFAARGRKGVHLPGSEALIGASAAALRAVDPRAADVLQFVRHVLVHDAIAPAVGRCRLAEHWGLED